MAEDTPSRARRGGAAAQDRTNEVSVQPPPDTPDDAPDKSTAVPGEGHVDRSDAVAAAQAGNEEVAAKFQVEQSQGYWGDNPAAEHNEDATTKGASEFLQLSADEQAKKLRERHEAELAARHADDWS